MPRRRALLQTPERYAHSYNGLVRTGVASPVCTVGAGYVSPPATHVSITSLPQWHSAKHLVRQPRMPNARLCGLQYPEVASSSLASTKSPLCLPHAAAGRSVPGICGTNASRRVPHSVLPAKRAAKNWFHLVRASDTVSICIQHKAKRSRDF